MPNYEESRPPAPVGGSDYLTNSHPDSTPPAGLIAGLPDVAAVREWAAQIFENACGIPVFGSPAWCGLDDDDPLRVVSAIRAGVAWVVETHSLRERLAAELRAADLDVVARVRAASLDVAGGTEWSEQARQIRQRADWLAAHPWAKRVTA